MNYSPEEAESNANSMTGLGKIKSLTCKFIIAVPWSCLYYPTTHKDLEAGNNGPVMETRVSYNLNMVSDHYYYLGSRVMSQSLVPDR